MKYNSLAKVTIIVLNYCNSTDTIDCLKSFEKIRYQAFNVVIIDNNSNDNSFDIIKNYLKTMKNKRVAFFNSTLDSQHDVNDYDYILINSKHNGGYGFGNNIGIKYALSKNCDYILVLNNDTIVDPDFLEPLIDTCRKKTNIGILTSKIYYHDRPDVIWFNGGSFSQCTAQVKHINIGEENSGQTPYKKNTFISGCMWFIPKNIFDTVGLINEDYFMYIEDLEFSQRVLREGYELAVCPESVIWHKVGSTTGGGLSEFSVYWRSKNMNHFIRNYITTLHCKITASVIYNVYMILKLLKNKKINLLKIHFKGFR